MIVPQRTQAGVITAIYHGVVVLIFQRQVEERKVSCSCV